MAEEKNYVLAIDQGTTSSRVIAYNLQAEEVCRASRKLAVEYPADAWVEQRAIDIWQTVKNCLEEVFQTVPAKEVLSVGITNQRETVLAWDPETGESLSPAIVWQCRRTAALCKNLREQGWAERIAEKTGLVVDAYFSASKIKWLIEEHQEIARRVPQGKVVFGTVDAWILYQLSKTAGEPVLATEASNASRTMLYNIHTGKWDEELLELFGLSERNLPSVKPSLGVFATMKHSGIEIPITAVLGDQQSSLFGHDCRQENSAKCTFGTGAFLLLNSGQSAPRSQSGLLTSVAWDLEGDKSYALEGSIFIAGALIGWLRDGLGIIRDAGETEERAKLVRDSKGVVLVPAFVGLGAPYWDESARGAILGLTQEASANHIIRAALESVAHQVADVLESPEFESLKELRIDGGMSENAVFAQSLADISNREILVSNSAEVTAFGAAHAAYLAATSEGGAVQNKETAKEAFQTQDRYKPAISPAISEAQRAEARSSWKQAVARVLLK